MAVVTDEAGNIHSSETPFPHPMQRCFIFIVHALEIISPLLSIINGR